jgi:hypothetical protein
LLAAVFAVPPAFAQDGNATVITDASRLSPQPDPDAITPGLEVKYLYQKFYSLDDIYGADVDPVPGEPIAMLDTATETDPATGKDKMVKVLTSDQTILVGAFIRGAIHFAESGDYVLRINSNDGVRVWIGGVMIWDDPKVHFDRMSPALRIAVQEPGWYEVKIDYFQKKGSWALQMLWTPPGGSEAVPVPPEALGHMGGA